MPIRWDELGLDKEIIMLREKGYSWERIGLRLNVSTGPLVKRARELGLVTKPRSRGNIPGHECVVRNLPASNT